MKIFNWVHKRFHHSALKDGFASNVKNEELVISINNADYNQGLMKQVPFSDLLLGGWKDGTILTIGTLGSCEPFFKPFNQDKLEFHALESEDDQDLHFLVEEGDGEDEEELNPLMHTAFEHDFEEEEDVVLNKVVVVMSSTPPPAAISDEAAAESTYQKKMKLKGDQRITLADLFLADSEAKMKKKLHPFTKVLLHQYSSDNKLSSDLKKSTSVKAKHGSLSFTKKLFPNVKDNPNPIKGVKKLLKKMLKRKIHPELDVKNQKAEGAGIRDDDDDNHKHGANKDTASLLQI